ncbi:MAG TPA: hypothetical protein VHF22_10995 [Planctomycetota bacterium]|nr:hypothetical protein [Planctomycetota bacterium]
MTATEAREVATAEERLRLRLSSVYEIGKALADFRSVDETVADVLRLVHASLPLASAVLLEGRGGDLRMIVWHGEGAAPEALLRAETNARASYAFLAAPVPPRSAAMDVRRAVLPFRRSPVDLDPGRRRRNFMTLPLVVARGAIFGALQVEGAGSLDEDDLAFVDAVVCLLSLAIDRHHGAAGKTPPFTPQRRRA